MPAAVSLPGTMPVDRLLYTVNELLGYEAEEKKIFRREDAEAFTVPLPSGGEETLYIFFIGDLEIGLFADPENDCVESAYVRSLLYGDDYTELQMMSFTGALLAAVEPNKYENMLAEVLPASEEERDVEKAASGEAWVVSYRRSLMNINAN